MTEQEAIESELIQRELANRQKTSIPSEHPLMYGVRGALSAVRSLPIMGGETGAQFEQAVKNPMDALKAQTGVMAMSQPVGSALAYGTSKLMDTPIMKQASDINQSWASKIPKEMLGHPEPTISAIGALGEIARRTTPEQYRQIPKTALSTVAFMGGQQLQNRVFDWGNNIRTTILDPLKSHKEGLSIAQEGVDLAKSAKAQLDNDISVFRGVTKDVPVGRAELQGEVDRLYGSAEKEVLEQLPEEFKSEMRSAIPSNSESNIGLIDKIKDITSKYIKWGVRDVTPAQQRLRNIYFGLDKLKDKSLESAGMLAEKETLDAMNQVATEVYTDVNAVKQMTRGITKGAIPSPKGLLGATAGDVEKREVLERLSQVEPKMKELIVRLVKYGNSKAAKQLIKQMGLEVAKYLPAGEVIGRVIKHKL